MAFVKLHATILDSSVWHQEHSIVKVWIAMMALADENGVVHLSAFGLQKRAAVSRDELAQAITYLEAPDPDSRNESNEGRRIDPIEGGWFLFNHGQHRDRQTDAQISGAARAQRFRDKRKDTVTRNKVTPRHASSRDILLEAEADKSQKTEAEFSTSELASEPTESAPSHDAPGEPEAPLGSEDTSGVPKAPHGGSSQASEDLSLAKRKPKKKREPSPEAIEIAQRLYQAINAHSPDMFGGDTPVAMEKRMLGWTLEIDRGLRAKDITVDDALLLIDYAHHPDDVAGSNGFTWHTNLLSGVAMRKQWKAKALLGKAKRWRDGKGQGSGRKGRFDIANDDYDYEAAAKRSDELFGTGAP